MGSENDEIPERHQPEGGGRWRGLRGRGRALSRHYQNPPCNQHTHAPQKKKNTSRETDRRTPKQAVRTFVNLVFLRGDTITRRKFIYADPSVKRAVTDTVLETCWAEGGQLTFVLQRVPGSYFHSSADGLSRSVNHLVVGESDVKFLKLPHDSAPLLGRSASAKQASRRCCSLTCCRERPGDQ